MAAPMEQLVSKRYPRELTLGDGTRLTLTPMVPSDWELLGGFLKDVPADERQLLRHDIADAAIVEQWCRDLDYKHILPVLAWVGGQVVADGTLHQDPDLWSAHLGRLRVMVHPQWRRRGIARLVLEELCSVAAEMGLHKAVLECVPAQWTLLSLLHRLGFREAARLEGFILDGRGSLHDMLVLVKNLQ